jgi:hypothetical protein
VVAMAGIRKSLLALLFNYAKLNGMNISWKLKKVERGDKS